MCVQYIQLICELGFQTYGRDFSSKERLYTRFQISSCSLSLDIKYLIFKIFLKPNRKVDKIAFHSEVGWRCICGAYRGQSPWWQCYKSVMAEKTRQTKWQVSTLTFLPGKADESCRESFLVAMVNGKSPGGKKPWKHLRKSPEATRLEVSGLPARKKW